MSPALGVFRPSTLQVCESAGPRFFGCRDDGLGVKRTPLVPQVHRFDQCAEPLA